MDINISSQIVVQTAAAWAADATVYSAKRILVTSDATYTGTDQRKFKIADGVQTWSNLDYVPIFRNTASNNTLPKSNGTDLVNSSITDDGSTTEINNDVFYFQTTTGAEIYADNTAAYITVDQNSNKFVYVDANEVRAKHSTRLQLDSPSVRVTQETPSRIAIIDASNDLKSADTATYPSLTELSYVKGVTSDIQTQLGTKVTSGGALGTPSSGTLTNCSGLPISGVTGYQGYSIFCAGGALNPADATTYYLGMPFLQASPSTTANSAYVVIPKAGTVKRIDVYVVTAGTTGSTETSTISFRLNNTTDTTISNALVTSGGLTPGVFTNSGLNIAVVAGDTFEIKWVTPTWATNPTTVRVQAFVYIE